jgi:hypothetical protein
MTPFWKRAAVVGALAFALAASSPTPTLDVGPNIPLNDAVGQFWSLKTVNDGSGNQIIVTSSGAPVTGATNAWSACATATGTSGTSVQAAPGAGLRNYITNITTANVGGSAANSLITIQSDPAGTPTTLWYTVNAANSGSNLPSFNPALQPGVNKAVGFTAGASSTTQYVCMSGYTGP